MISMISYVYFTCIRQAPRGRGGSELRQEMTRADFALNQIGPKKRLAYETDTERTRSGWRTLENAP